MKNNCFQEFSTLCVHAGEKRDVQGAIHSPLYNHSTFAFATTKDLLDVVEDLTGYTDKTPKITTRESGIMNIFIST